MAEVCFQFRRAGVVGLTLCGFGVVLGEGLVFWDVGVQEAERVLGDVLGCHHLVGADDVGQRDGRQLLLCVRLHRVEERLVCAQKVRSQVLKKLKNRD